jgi:glycosyltransferase involved in cell wall biosynthesis
MKKVYVDPIWKVHALDLKEYFPYPPEGYQYVVSEGAMENTAKLVSRLSFSPWLVDQLYKAAPLTLIKSYMEGFTKKIPEDIDLTFAISHLVFRREPWVIWLGLATDPVGLYLRHLKRYKKVVEHSFASEYCKGIISATEYAKSTVLSTLDCRQFEHKIEVVHGAVHKKEFTKSYNNDRVRLLFMGTAHMIGGFDFRGGKEVLEVFKILSKKYSNLELVIRSEIPRHIRKQYWECLELPGVRLIEDLISREQLDGLYKSSDIFVFPSHAGQEIILEAMSYQLPPIVTDVPPCREFVDDNRTGFVTRGYAIIPYEEGGILAPGMSSKAQKACRRLDLKVVADVVDKTSVLIENRELRRRMGEAARWEIEEGKFSVERRNEKLKRIFEGAI